MTTLKRHYVLLALSIATMCLLAAQTPGQFVNGDFEKGYLGWQVYGKWLFVFHPSPGGVHAALNIGENGALCQRVSAERFTFQYRMPRGESVVTSNNITLARLRQTREWKQLEITIPFSFAPVQEICFTATNARRFSLDNISSSNTQKGEKP